MLLLLPCRLIVKELDRTVCRTQGIEVESLNDQFQGCVICRDISSHYTVLDVECKMMLLRQNATREDIRRQQEVNPRIDTR